MTKELLALVAFLGPKDESLLAAMKSAIAEPQAYLAKHDQTAMRLLQSTSPATDPEFPWLVLIDELEDRHWAEAIDWDDGRDDILWSLQQLKIYPRLSAETKMALARLPIKSGLEYLREVAAAIARDGFVLASMDIESDSYEVTIVARADFDEAAKLARDAGFRLTDVLKKESE